MLIYVAQKTAESSRMVAQVLSERCGAEVRVFETSLALYASVQRGEEGREERPDAIVVDVLMPRLGGIVMSRLLKFHDALSSISVIVTSSSGSAEMEADARAARVDDLVLVSDKDLRLYAAEVVRHTISQLDAQRQAVG